jgi:2-polyprenyl-6-hydroxyphenyl methylase/3-demethylubiquinone-9 3-methyltransferase
MADIDAAEAAKFSRMAASWWDPRGPAAPLHAVNPLRLDYILDQAALRFGRDRRARRPLEGLTALDVGCGGGLVAEPLARLGAAVTGLDASGEMLGAARAHAEAGGLAIDYRADTAEALALRGETFDLALALEVVEHVADPAAFCGALGALTKPGGLLVASTINRTAASLLKAKFAAERVLGWLPPGTHDWRRFPTPRELAGWIEAAGLRVADRTGMAYSPLRGGWRLAPDDLSVNYLLTAERD